MAIWGIGDKSLQEDEISNKLTKELRSNVFILLSAPLGLKRKLVVLSLAISYKMTKGIVSLIRDKIKI